MKLADPLGMSTFMRFTMVHASWNPRGWARSPDLRPVRRRRLGGESSEESLPSSRASRRVVRGPRTFPATAARMSVPTEVRFGDASHPLLRLAPAPGERAPSVRNIPGNPKRSREDIPVRRCADAPSRGQSFSGKGRTVVAEGPKGVPRRFRSGRRSVRFLRGCPSR